MPSLSPRDVQTGASVDNGHMLSDGTNHRRILKETEKQSGRVAIVATIVWVGIAWRAPALSPRKCTLVCGSLKSQPGPLLAVGQFRKKMRYFALRSNFIAPLPLLLLHPARLTIASHNIFLRTLKQGWCIGSLEPHSSARSVLSSDY